MRRHLLGWFVALGTFVSACDDDRERNEAMLFFERFETLDVETPLAEREPQVARLEQLALHEESVVHVRDACVRAHRTIMRAEEQTALARTLLPDDMPESQLTPDVRTRIETALASSAEAVESARGLMAQCDREASALRHRFGARRGGH